MTLTSTSFVSGQCDQGAELAERGHPESSARVRAFHASCPGRRNGVECICLCHDRGKPPPIQERIRQARRQKMIEAGVDPDRPARSRDGRTFCRHDHEMTPDNTGPRGECRACKREASQRCKARRAEREKEEKA